MLKAEHDEARALIRATIPINRILNFVARPPGDESWEIAVELSEEHDEPSADMAGMAAMCLSFAAQVLGRYAVRRGWRPADEDKWPEFGPYDE